MPRYTQTIDLEDELEELAAQRRELAERDAAFADDERDLQNPEFAEIRQEASDVEAHYQAVSWAVDPPDDDPTRDEPWEEVTVAALNTVDSGELEGRTQKAASEIVGGSELAAGAGTAFFIAKGVIDAPFYETESPSFDDRVAAVRDLPPQFGSYLESLVDDVSSVGADEGKSYDDLVRELQTQETSAETS